MCRRIGAYPSLGSAHRAVGWKSRRREDTCPGRPAWCTARGPIVDFCQAAKISTVIDRRYRLSEVPEALRYLGEGHAKGKVVAMVE